MDGNTTITTTRVKNETIIKPIVYGNVAEYFGYKRESDGHTHKWTVYLRPYKEGDDLSMFIKKVQFKLHESYGINQNRVVMEPPYEITETGWGEFEIQIKIFFMDVQEKPVIIYHILKLFPLNLSQSSNESNFSGISIPDLDRNLVVSEFYDELTFQEPTLFMHRLLTKYDSENLPISQDHSTNFEEKKILVLKAIAEAQAKVNHDIKMYNEKLRANQELMKAYHAQIENHEKNTA